MAAHLPWRASCLRLTFIFKPSSSMIRRPILPCLKSFALQQQRRTVVMRRSDIYLYDGNDPPAHSKINPPQLLDDIPYNPTEEEIYSNPKASFFPEQTHKSVSYWLFGTAGLVFGIVVLGGLTRLTESGLSITEWKPVTGVLPPTSSEAWNVEFAKYKDSPEFRVLNPTMSLSEYKFIYYMEWAHRILGRVIGVGFILPAAYFVARKKVSKPMSLGLLAIGAGIGFQGLIGWWMVKSGLQDDLFQKPGSVPRVSQYRLTAHLGAAFAVYSAIVYSGLAILGNSRPAISKSVEQLADLKRIRPVALALTGLVFLTALSGGLVAGLDAGLIYNEFPYMGNNLTPPTSELFDPFYSHTPAPHPDLYWRNLLENPSTVQLQHRILAASTFCSVLSFWVFTRRVALPRSVLKASNGLVHLVSLQVVLGITTLLYLVPTPIAAAHQANSLLLLTGCLALLATLRRRGPQGVMRAMKSGQRKAGNDVEYLKPYLGADSLRNV